MTENTPQAETAGETAVTVPEDEETCTDPKCPVWH